MAVVTLHLERMSVLYNLIWGNPGHKTNPRKSVTPAFILLDAVIVTKRKLH